MIDAFLIPVIALVCMAAIAVLGLWLARRTRRDILRLTRVGDEEEEKG